MTDTTPTIDPALSGLVLEIAERATALPDIALHGLPEHLRPAFTRDHLIDTAAQAVRMIEAVERGFISFEGETPNIEALVAEQSDPPPLDGLDGDFATLADEILEEAAK